MDEPINIFTQDNLIINSQNKSVNSQTGDDNNISRSFPAKKINDTDVMELKEQFEEALLELELKRVTVDQLTKQQHKLQTEKIELKNELEIKQKEIDYIQKQVNELNEISRKREDEWGKFRNNWAQNKIKSEICSKSSDAQKQQISDLQQEILCKNIENEELKKKIRENDSWKKKCSIFQERTEITVQTLLKQIQNLRGDHMKLERATKSLTGIGKCTEQFKKVYEELLLNKTKENISLKRRVIDFATQLENVKRPRKDEFAEGGLADSSTSNNMENCLLTFVRELKAKQQQNYEKMFEELVNIKEIYESFEKLQLAEIKANETIKQLEQILEEERKAHTKPEVSDFECQVGSTNENSGLQVDKDFDSVN